MCFLRLYIYGSLSSSGTARFITKVNSVSPFVTLAHGGLLGIVLCMHVCFNINQVVVELEQILPLKMLTVVLTKLFADFIIRTAKKF